MKFVLRNALRNKRRTLLTGLSFALSLFVFLSALNARAAMDDWDREADRHHRLVVHHALGMAHQLPASMAKELRERLGDRLEGDEEGRPLVQRADWLRAFTSDPQDWFGAVAVDPEPLRAMWPDLLVSAESYAAFRKSERAVLIGERLWKRMRSNGYPWDVGRSITLHVPVFHCVLQDLTIAGITRSENAWGEEQLILHWSYLDRATGGKGRVQSYWLKARDAASLPELKARIDAEYRNSPFPTETQTEREYADSVRSMMGDFRGGISVLGIVISLLLLAVAGNTMAMTYRDRAGEVAILRALGFGRLRIVALFAAESILISLSAGLLAVGLGLFLYNMAGITPEPRALPALPVTWGTAARVLALAACAGLLGALLPGWGCVRRPIVAGLRSAD